METDLPIYGLACPSTKHASQEFDTHETKCGCKMSTTNTATVSGTIKNATTKLPFEAGLVNVYNIQTGKGTTPDADGLFHLQASPSDVISISFVGFKTIKLQASKLPMLIELQEENQMLNEVVITGKKQQDNYLYIGLGLTALLFVYAIAKDDKKTTKKVRV